ncbi:alpha-1,4-glucan--maltose-1-phosphate maltosyltransferase, partial [Candidatus Omnitrophota bacterium]
QSGWVQIPIEKLGVDPAQSYLAHDFISGDKFIWHGERNFIELDPQVCPAHILKIHPRLRREQDFDYFT